MKFSIYLNRRVFLMFAKAFVVSQILAGRVVKFIIATFVIKCLELDFFIFLKLNFRSNFFNLSLHEKYST